MSELNANQLHNFVYDENTVLWNIAIHLKLLRPYKRGFV